MDIFLVVGENSYAACEAKESIESVLSDYKVTTYNGFSTHPNIEDTEFGIRFFGHTGADVVIAIGEGYELQ